MGGNFDEGRGNAVVYASYSEREALYQGERDFSSFALTENSANTALIPGGSSGIPGTRVFSGPTLPNGQTLGRFNQDGTGNTFTAADRFNYAPDNFLQLPQERFLVNAMAHYDLTESARAYTEVTFTRNQVDSELAPTPLFTTLVVNPNSAFFGADVQQALNTLTADANGNVTIPYIGRRMVEVGSRQSLDTRDGLRILVGVEGELNETWNYDAYYSKSILDRIQLQNGNVSRSRVAQAALVNDSATACQNPANGCVPLNLFGAGNISQAAANFIGIGAINITSIEQQVAQGSISGTIGSLPTADESIGLVVGLEYRQDDSRFQPDTALSSGDVSGFNAGNPTVGGFNVTELFTEISIPVTNQIEAWGAYRYSDYSNIGGVSSFATALSFAPTDKMRFRAGFQTAVRAPNVSELFSGGGQGFPGATDPCSAAGFIPGTTDAALCAATGLSPAAVGVFTQANTQIQGQFGGNVNLAEEESDTFTLGAVFQPTENLDITVDYFDIEITDAIDVLGGSVNNVLDICYNQVRDISSPFCQAISRRPDGNVGNVNVLNSNIGALETSGIDFNIAWSKDLDFGIGGEGSTLDISTKATYLLAFDETPVSELPGTNECAGSFGNTCGSPLNELIVNTRVTWNSGKWGLSALVRYLSAVDDEVIEISDTPRDQVLVDELSAEVYLDLAATYAFSDDFSMNFGINNILDTEPTQIGDQQEQGNTFPSTYDLLGPRAFLSVNYRFR
jgi:outer membrane receptor protein involved in Fe transport